MEPEGLVVVAGGGGFIGGWLARSLVEAGAAVRVVDIKPLDEWHQRFDDAENLVLDLRDADACRTAVAGTKWVFDLACNMGGMGFIESHKAECMLSVLIGTHLLVAARDEGVERFFFSSSACVYAAAKQESPDVEPLREADAYPAMPEDGYGWEKLFIERLCRHFTEDFGLTTRIARYHNVYGPYGAYDGGREKAPAAISRKVAAAVLSGNHEIEIWGDGKQTRSFTFIDDCLEGTQRLMRSDVEEPINVGSSELVTVNELVDIVEAAAGVQLEREYKLDAPLGVRGRNSDNTLVQERLGWEPSTSLATGMERTYRWIYDEMARQA
ncbi:MAG: NAD-dependent epimerase/dehydratase family protein [Acidimicrobiia bacterium]|nr:NAD-dependent epimerase/dehydratase family protein [Acidimicrobiia bacterium]